MKHVPFLVCQGNQEFLVPPLRRAWVGAIALLCPKSPKRRVKVKPSSLLGSKHKKRELNFSSPAFHM